MANPLSPHASTPAAGSRLERFRARWRRDPNDPPRRWMRRHWPWLSLLGLAIVAVLAMDAWLVTCGFVGCPSTEEIRGFRPAEGGKILDRNNRFLGRIAAVRRVNVELKDVPLHVRQAFVATEDRRFYQHNGLDWRGLVRAAARNVRAGGVREGFSTITMQAARNTFLQQRYNGRSLKRKLIELRLTRLMEHALTKDQILELYLNVIYLGNGMHGVEAASRDLFQKSVSQLSLTEGAVLAGLPKAPSSYTPRRSERRARGRRDVVLALMEREGYISSRTRERAQGVPLRIAETEWRPLSNNEPLAVDAVRAFVDSVLPDVLKEGDVTVYTTLDQTAQRAADRVIIRHAAAIGRGVQGVLVALDPNSGDIRALVPGSRLNRGGFNRAMNARRQPGSAFKPFVYEAALAAGLKQSEPVDDTPIEVMIDRNTPWTPANYDDSYAGRVTLRQALERSANAATVRVSRTVGERNVIAAARRNGITSPLTPVPSIALGALEVTPMELVSAYAPFANGGFRVKPRLVTRVEAADGTVLWTSEPERHQVMDPRDAYELTSMLRAVVDFGTGRPIRDYGITAPVAGKTGTTNTGADVWFVGYTPTLVAGIWFGYDQPRPIAASASGGRFAAPAWAEFYANGWREPHNSDFLPPAGMVARVIDPESGQLATEYCPRRVREWFKPQSVPTEPCELHTAPVEEYQIQVDAGEADPAAREVERAVERAQRGIGGILRRIFKF